MNLSSILKQPFPYDAGIRGKIMMAVFFGIFIFGFLMVFKPFQLDQYSFNRLLIICIVYGSITFFCILIPSILLPFLFPGIFNESSWTTGKQIILTAGIIFFVGLANYLVSPLMVDTQLTLYNVLWFQGITLAIGLIPVSLYILIRQNRLLKMFSREAEVIEKKLQEKHEIILQKAEVEEANTPVLEVPVSNKLVLVGNYQNEKLELYPDDLYMVTSASNYIKIFHLKKEKLVYSIIRLTLKKAEETILNYPNFFKCHRAFIINLDKVVHVEGNAQGYKIKIKAHEELIPVSRNLNKEFSDKLLAFRTVS